MMGKENKGITLIALAITIVIFIILTGITISLTLGEEGLMQRAKDTKLNIQLAKEEMETRLNELNSNTGGNDEFENDELTTENAELVAFKLAISDAIYESSENKLQISDHKTALTEEFTNGIKQIVTEVTKDATATEADIINGKTAYINGTKVTGTAQKGSSVIKLGSGTSFNVSSYEGYESFTEKNFIVEVSNASTSATASGYIDDYATQPRPNGSANVNISKSYNATKGVFKVTAKLNLTATTKYKEHIGDEYNVNNESVSSSKDLTTTVYLITD